MRTFFLVTNGGRSWTFPRERCSRGTSRPPTSAARRTSTACRPAGSGHRHPRRPCARDARRLGHHRPHLARGRDQDRQPGWPVPDQSRDRAARLQHLRLAARQPRGDDPRHVRQHQAAQPASPWHRGQRDAEAAGGRADLDLRGVARLHRARNAADRARRQGVRLGFIARLGSQGDGAARCPRCPCRVVRADPPVEPDRDGRAAAAVQARRERGLARPHRPRGLRHHRDRRPSTRATRRAR